MLSIASIRAIAATRLPWLGAAILRCFGGFLGLARLSLVLCGVSMLSGCLVDDPPPFRPPQKTRPRLEYTKASPGLDQLIVANSGDLVKFEVPVTSEDAGEELYALLFLDDLGNQQLNSGRLPASTLDDPNVRKLSLLWTVRGPGVVRPGCHRIVLRVTHFSNIIPNTDNELFDKNDLDEAYWFANVNVSPETANSLVDCPLASVGAD